MLLRQTKCVLEVGYARTEVLHGVVAASIQMFEGSHCISASPEFQTGGG